jgi:hypothetical protein
MHLNIQTIRKYHNYDFSRSNKRIKEIDKNQYMNKIILIANHLANI